MAKLINTSSLDSLAKGLDDRAKELVEVEKNRALAAEGVLQTAIDGKSDDDHTHNDIYYTKTEIDADYYTSEQVDDLFASVETDITTALSAKLDTSVATEHFIQSALSQEGESYDSHTLFKGEKVISPLVNTNTVIDDDGTTLTTYLSYFDTSITSLSSSIGNGDELLTDAKDSVVSCINELQTEINTHNHNDSYYTKTEIDTKESDLSGAIADEESRAKAEEQVLSERIDTLSSDKADATALNSYQLITDDTLSTANKTIPNAINELLTKITDEESRAKAEEEALSKSIDTINANKADTTALNSYQLITDDTLETSNKKIPNAINELKSTIETNASNTTTNFSNVNSSIASIESKNNTQDSEISTLKTDVSDLITRMGGITLKQVTQAEYDALATKESNVLYIITQ